jgi:hypothetical protein
MFLLPVLSPTLYNLGRYSMKKPPAGGSAATQTVVDCGN